MNTKTSFILAAVLAILCGVSCNRQCDKPLRVMSYNIRLGCRLLPYCHMDAPARQGQQERFLLCKHASRPCGQNRPEGRIIADLQQDTADESGWPPHGSYRRLQRLAGRSVASGHQLPDAQRPVQFRERRYPWLVQRLWRRTQGDTYRLYLFQRL